MLSREAMTQLGMVTAGGCQLTLDLIVSHNQMYPDNQVSSRDLVPSVDPDHACRGTLPLKSGVITCGCPLRADAPEPLTHREIADFDSLLT